MGFFLKSEVEPENAVPLNFCASPKTHVPGSPVQKRGYRFHIPEVGRWISRDPIGEKAFVVRQVLVKLESLYNALLISPSWAGRSDRAKQWHLREIRESILRAYSEAGLGPVYLFIQNSPASLYDLLGLIPFKNNCTQDVPYKPESTSGGYDAGKKYNCHPGQTCDVDGVYPSGGGNPIKICNQCTAVGNMVGTSCQVTVNCTAIGNVCQMCLGGQVTDTFLNDHPDWPKPGGPVQPDL